MQKKDEKGSGLTGLTVQSAALSYPHLSPLDQAFSVLVVTSSTSGTSSTSAVGKGSNIHS